MEERRNFPVSFIRFFCYPSGAAIPRQARLYSSRRSPLFLGELSMRHPFVGDTSSVRWRYIVCLLAIYRLFAGDISADPQEFYTGNALIYACYLDINAYLCQQKTTNMENQENNNGQLQIELKPEVGVGKYANLAIITHSTSEFVLDFVEVLPGMPKAPVQSRVILAPEHAKRLLRALEDNIAKYERNMGPIAIPEESPLPFPNATGEA